MLSAGKNAVGGVGLTLPVMCTTTERWLPFVMAATSISGGSSPGLRPHARALIGSRSVKKEHKSGSHPGAGCPPQTMSSDPAINIDVITCHEVGGAILKSLLPHGLRFTRPGRPLFAYIFFGGGGTLLISCCWLSSACERGCFFPEFSVNRHVKFLGGKKVVCKHSVYTNTQSCHLKL